MLCGPLRESMLVVQAVALEARLLIDHDLTVRDRARDERRSGDCFDTVPAVHPCASVRNSLECLLENVDDVLGSKTLESINKVGGAVEQHKRVQQRTKEFST